MVLSASWTLGLAPAAKLPDALPAAPSKPKAPGYRPHPLGRPRPEADNVIALEVNACVHRLIDVIILDHEKQTLVIETECRSAINSIIDQVVLDAESNPFSDLKSVRRRYSHAIKRKVIDLVGEASSSQGISRRQAVKQLQKVAGYDKLVPHVISRWSKQGPNKKRGRKVNSVFEWQVVSQLIYTKIEKVDDVHQIVVLANILR